MNFRQLYNEHVAQAWERMKSLVKNCLTHGLATWMVIQTFYAVLNFTSRNLLDDMMANYTQWDTKQYPTGKKVNYVEEIASLSDKVVSIMSLLRK